MPALKPYRSYDETTVVNGVFKYDGAVPAYAGTFVKPGATTYSGASNLSLLASVGQAYSNSLSPRWLVTPTVVPCNNSGDRAIGMLLYDVRETDENGEKLVFNPRKAEENNWVISGNAAVLATEGIFLYSGVNGGAVVTADPVPGAPAFLGNDGGVNTTGSNDRTQITKVGQFLSNKDAQGWVLFKLDIDAR
jgi:hypothetical protein